VSGPEGTVQDRLADAYRGTGVLHPEYLLVVLGVAVGWWLVFDGLGAFVLALSLLLFSIGIDSARTALASRRWPTTDATVLESTVFTQHELRERFPGLEQKASSTSGGYVPFVRYRYTVNGEDHIGVRISPFDSGIPRRRWAENIVDQYVTNEFTRVRYDSQNPNRSYLQSWVKSRLLLVWLLSGLVSIGFAAWSAAGYPNPLVLGWGVAVFVVLLGVRQFWLGLRTRRWPTVRGELVADQVRSSSSQRGGTSYHPKVRYQYEVGGTTYVSTSIGLNSGPSFNSRSEAQAWLENLKSQADLKVYYDPKRPDRTVLEPSGALGGLGITLIGLGGLAVLYNLTTGQPLPYQTRILGRLESVLVDLLDRI